MDGMSLAHPSEPILTKPRNPTNNTTERHEGVLPQAVQLSRTAKGAASFGPSTRKDSTGNRPIRSTTEAEPTPLVQEGLARHP